MTSALIATALSVWLLAGCAGPASQHVANERSQAGKAQFEQLMAARGPVVPGSPVSYSERSWIALRKVERAPRDLGKEKTDAVQVEINQHFQSLNEVAGAVSALTGLPVIVGADVLAPGGTAVAPATISPLLATAFPAGLPPGIRPPNGGPLPPVFAPPLAVSAVPSGPIGPYSPFVANYAGSLTGFMNLVAAYYGTSWKVDGAGLCFYALDSRTFRIAALPGDTRLSSSVDAGAGSSAAGGAAGAAAPTSSVSTTNSTGVGFNGLSVWTALESAVKQMLGANGRVVATPATGSITVTDTPAVLDRVSDYIEEQNKSLNRQVSVHVRVLSVELDEGETYGIQWDLVYARLLAASPYAIGFKTAETTAEGAGSLVLSAPATSASRFAGTSALISALSTQGRVMELTSATVVTLNNQPVPVNVGRRISYLASSTTSQTANVGTSTSLTPGTVSTGFSLSLVPHIIDGRELLLQYSVDLSSLLRMQTISSGGSTIEVPDVASSSFIQRVRLASNETLVVAGFDQDNLSAVAEGVGHAQNTLMGQRNGTAKRTMLVITIQPTLAM